MTGNADAVLTRLDGITPDLTALYKDLHAHPELSFAEGRTAVRVAERLKRLGLEVVTGVGRTGVVGRLRNGAGPTVLLRADMDALPVAERTGLPYASTATSVDHDGHRVHVAHACGHDMHIVCLLGALDLLAGSRDRWSGTLVAAFQPAEETGRGAQAMVDDGLFDRFGRPDVVLGQHVAPFPAGWVGCHAGPAFAAADALRVTLHGRGGHGSRPETTIDPVVMAASTVMRLQTIVSREVPGGETAVVTVGSLRAGTKDNVIPDDAELGINVRSYSEGTRAAVLGAVERIVRAEAVASGAVRDPEIATVHRFPLLTNDPGATERTLQAFRDRFGADNVIDPGPVTASEDVGVLATAAGAPLCYWLLGGADPHLFVTALKAGTVNRDVPSNHSPEYAPVIDPTLATGITAMTTAARTWLGL